MYSATFIFDKKQFDDEFHALDAQIAAAARETVGFLGDESWEDPNTGRLCNVYYWADEIGLRQLMHHPSHLRAKAGQAQWLDGYQVIVSQVLRSYGDERINHPTRRIEPEGGA